MDVSPTKMGNSQTLSCTSGEKSSKAQKKEEQYTKTAPADKTNGDVTTSGAADDTAVVTASVEQPQENGVEKPDDATTKSDVATPG